MLDWALTLVVLIIAELALAFLAAIRAPVGFEDELGFHLGLAHSPASGMFERDWTQTR